MKTTVSKIGDTMKSEILFKTNDVEVARSKKGTVSFSYSDKTNAMLDLFARIAGLEEQAELDREVINNLRVKKVVSDQIAYEIAEHLRNDSNLAGALSKIESLIINSDEELSKKHNKLVVDCVTQHVLSDIKIPAFESQGYRTGYLDCIAKITDFNENGK